MNIHYDWRCLNQMLMNLFTLQAGRTSPVTFTPVVETQVGEGDEVFIGDYPMRILLSGDLEPVPWMVGFTSNEGVFFTTCENIYFFYLKLITTFLLLRNLHGHRHYREMFTAFHLFSRWFLAWHILRP
jgi:hypothetical protein